MLVHVDDPEAQQRFVRLPQDISLARMRCQMSEAASRVLEVILFECYAFRDRAGRAQPIGLRWFVRQTGLQARNVQRGVAELVSRRIIVAVRSGRNRTCYAIRPPDCWTPARARPRVYALERSPLYALERSHKANEAITTNNRERLPDVTLGL
jgi:hypothetical protein